MHIIIGGAYNGKRNYVEQMVKERQVHWYEGMKTIHLEFSEVIVLEKLHQIEEHELMEIDELVLAQKLFKEVMEITMKCEQLYIILEDIGRGIVPIDAQQRKLRDVLGRLYQLLFNEAQSIQRIWYGLSQQLK